MVKALKEKGTYYGKSWEILVKIWYLPKKKMAFWKWKYRISEMKQTMSGLKTLWNLQKPKPKQWL